MNFKQIKAKHKEDEPAKYHEITGDYFEKAHEHKEWLIEAIESLYQFHLSLEDKGMPHSDLWREYNLKFREIME